MLVSLSVPKALRANWLWLTGPLSEDWWFLRRKATKPDLAHFVLMPALKLWDSFVQLTAPQASNYTPCYWLPSSASLWRGPLMMAFYTDCEAVTRKLFIFSFWPPQCIIKMLIKYWFWLISLHGWCTTLDTSWRQSGPAMWAGTSTMPFVKQCCMCVCSGSVQANRAAWEHLRELAQPKAALCPSVSVFKLQVSELFWTLCQIGCFKCQTWKHSNILLSSDLYLLSYVIVVWCSALFAFYCWVLKEGVLKKFMCIKRRRLDQAGWWRAKKYLLDGGAMYLLAHSALIYAGSWGFMKSSKLQQHV